MIETNKINKNKGLVNNNEKDRKTIMKKTKYYLYFIFNQ